MAGFNRRIDPRSRDYVSDGKGGTLKDRDARTPLYLAIKIQKGLWPLGPEDGSTFHELRRTVSDLTTVRVVVDKTINAVQPLVDAGRVEPPVIRTERILDRINEEVCIVDIQTGEELELTDLLPLVT